MFRMTWTTGPRVYWRGRRQHHGKWGCYAIAVGLLAVWHDRHDRPFWWSQIND